MPITRSAKKALRQSEKRHAHNLKKKHEYKKVVKEIRQISDSRTTDEAKNLLPRLYKALDKAAKTHVIEKNKARRLKSRLTKLVMRKKPPEKSVS